MTKILLSILIFSSLGLSALFCQSGKIIPQKGIEGVPIKIGVSSLDDVIKTYGKTYQKTYLGLLIRYKYESLGLSFSIDPLDKKKFIQSISIESPFQAFTDNGIRLNESSMNDVWRVYASKKIENNGKYTWYEEDEIMFYAAVNVSEFDSSAIISKIHINNGKRNFEVIAQVVDVILPFLKEEPFDADSLRRFFERKNGIVNPYLGSLFFDFSREIEEGLQQEYIPINLIGQIYKVTALRQDDQLVFLRLVFDSTTIFERRNETLLNSILAERKKTNPAIIDIENALDFPSETFVYGSFCGIGGSPPDKCKEMLRLVNRYDYVQLSRWLYSLNPEIATYGYLGMDFMRRRGIIIKKPERDFMKKMKTSQIQLNTCQGCIYGETETIAEALSTETLKWKYKAFRKLGWLD